MSALALVVASLDWWTSEPSEALQPPQSCPPDPNDRIEIGAFTFFCSVVASALADWVVLLLFEPLCRCEMSPPSPQPPQCPPELSEDAHWPWAIPCSVVLSFDALALVSASFDWFTQIRCRPQEASLTENAR